MLGRRLLLVDPTIHPMSRYSWRWRGVVPRVSLIPPSLVVLLPTVHPRAVAREAGGGWCIVLGRPPLSTLSTSCARSVRDRCCRRLPLPPPPSRLRRVSPPIPRRSTHCPPHEQLLVRLEVGGASLVVVVFILPLVVLFPRRSTHCPPHEQLLVRLEVGGASLVVVVFVLVPLVVSFPRSSSSPLVCPRPRRPLVSSRPSRVSCFPTHLSSSHPVYTPRAVAHGGGGGVLAALVPPRSSFQSPSSPPHPPTLPRLRRPHSTCDPPHEQSLVRLGAGGVVCRLASLRCYQQLRT